MNATSDVQQHDTQNGVGKGFVVPIISWLIVAWTCFIFLGSLPYKFTNHPDTQHIFTTIGEWMKGILGNTIGDLFSSFGAYGVGVVELLTSILLLSPIVYWLKNRGSQGADTERFRSRVHAIGGALASMVMAGAAFFHIFTPLGIAVLHKGESDGGSLFRAAVSILILGIVMFFINKRRGFTNEVQ
ncbi:MAG: hypothetical protein AB8B64_10575 [Granulosicoccus sp.]